MDTLLFLLSDLNPIQWRLGQIDVALFYQFRHVAVEKGEQQGGDVIAINIRITIYENLAVAQPAVVELFAQSGSYTTAKILYLLIFSYLICAGLLHISDLAPQGQNRLKAAVPGLFAGAASRVALNNEQLGLVYSIGGAISQFAR